MRELLQCNHWERAPEWLSERYIQHNPNGRSGRDGIMAFFTRTRPRTENCGKLTTPLVAVLADGDLVTVVLHREYDHPARAGREVHEHVVLSVARRRRQARRALGARDDRGALSRADAAGSQERLPRAAEEPLVHLHHGADARARHRREHGDLRRREQAAAESAAVSRCRPARLPEGRAVTRARFVFPPPSAVASAWRDEARSLEGVEGFASRDVLAYDENGARVLRGMRITPGLPAFLGVAPLLGRGFTPADAEVGAPAVVVLSYEMWQRDYGGANDVIGRAVTLDEVSHVVVGVMPPRWDAFARCAPGRLVPAVVPGCVGAGFRSLEILGSTAARRSARRGDRRARGDPRARGGRSSAAVLRRRRRRPRDRAAVGPPRREHARCAARAARRRRSRAARRLLQRGQPAARARRVSCARAFVALGARREHLAARARAVRGVPRARARGRRRRRRVRLAHVADSRAAAPEQLGRRSAKCSSIRRCSRSRSACRSRRRCCSASRRPRSSRRASSATPCAMAPRASCGAAPARAYASCSSPRRWRCPSCCS